MKDRIRMRFLNRFRKLQWKLTASYTLVSSLMFILGMFIVTALTFVLILRSEEFNQIAAIPLAEQASVFFNGQEVDQAELESWLDGIYVDGGLQFTADNIQFSFDHIDLLAVLDSQSEVLAVEPTGKSPLLAQLSEPELEAIQSALNDDPDLAQMWVELDGQELALSAHPIKNELNGAVMGVFVMRHATSETNLGLTWGILPALLPFTVAIIVTALVVGAVSAFFSARPLTKRLGNVTDIAQTWSSGDFSAKIRDNSQDEIGQLGRHLNQMAEQLDLLMDSRTQLAAVEERNRIARDLHDSAKQQLFATTMQLKTAQLLFESDLEGARRHLDEGVQLAGQSQNELTGLIQALRPVQLADKGLFEAVRELAKDFQRQNGIPVEVKMAGERTLPLAVEQAFFRVAQEALSNVSRHAKAKRVSLQLSADKEQVRMEVEDNGVGFVERVNAGIGVPSMQERMAGVGGELGLESEPGQGTIVTAVCPIL